MLVFDTETTGLVEPTATPLDKQPYIIEFGAIKLDSKTLKEVGRLSFLVKPPIPLQAKITEITGLRDKDLEKAMPFARHVMEVSNFFLGEDTIVAHNCPFDMSLLKFELMRLDRQFRFPWPPNQICTAEISMGINKGKRMRLLEMYKWATGKVLDQKHRAIDDVEALIEVIKKLRKENLI